MKTATLKIVALLVAAISIVSCRKAHNEALVTASEEVPLLPEQPFDYPNSSNDHLATLGRVLFYEKQLSRNGNISCGSCHKQESAFCDNLKFSPGTHNLVTKRNTPSVFNRTGRLFWDGRANSIPDLVLRPVKDEVEMDVQNISALTSRLSNLDYYTHLFRAAFPKATRLDSVHVQTAISEFVRNFNFSRNRFQMSQRGETQLTAEEELGKNLFFGRARCGNCHHLNGNFNNNSGYGQTDQTHNIGLDAVVSDAGAGAISGNKHEEGAFLMPVLLNIELTAPYMHDGRFSTLEEVVEHYNSEIKDNPNLSQELRDFMTGKPVKLNLNDQEKKALVAFLRTLTDPSILTDPRFSDPFIKR